jgi:hypothetical protein
VAEGDEQADEGTLEIRADDDDSHASPPVSEEPWQSMHPIEEPKPWWKRWQVLAGVGGTAVVVVAVSLYFIKGKNAAPTKVVVSKKEGGASKTRLMVSTDDADSPDEKEAKAKLPENKTAARAPVVAAFKMSACRLAAELAARPDATNDKYAGKIIEIVGRFHRLDSQVADSPVSGMHAIFLVEGPPVGCALSDSLVDKKRWEQLGQGDGLAVRGLYVKNGILQQAELMPVAPPADDKYKGKEIEVSGFVDAILPQDDDQAFPSVKLEAGTNSLLEVRCLFRKSEETELKKLRPGAAVVIKGTCGGRHGEKGGKPYVRIDNSEFVYTSGPTAAVARHEAPFLAREYEEDMRSVLLPPLGGEEKLSAPVALADLAREACLGHKATEKKYLHKVVTVVGKPQTKVPPRQLFLESGRTDQQLRVLCVFAKRQFAELDEAAEFRVRGFCTGFADSRTLRLDNCELVDSAGSSDIRKITADFLPHTPGASFTFDVATAATSDKKETAVMRVLAEQRDGGITETYTSHVGTLAGGWLLGNRDSAKWVQQPKIKKVRVLGPVFYHRLSAGFVEVGQVTVTGPGRSETVWQPALKVGARAGTTWNWAHANTDYQYVVEKFDEFEGRPCAVIVETQTRPPDLHHPRVVRHVYVRGWGEVERQEWLQVTSRDRRILVEKKLVQAP